MARWCASRRPDPGTSAAATAVIECGGSEPQSTHPTGRKMSDLGRREEIRVPEMSEPISHFTHVVKAGRLVFVSGCVATDGQGRLVGGGDVFAQAPQGHEKIK